MKEGEKMSLNMDFIRQGLLTYAIETTYENFNIRMALVHINPDLEKFILERGEVKTSCGVKILPNTRLVLGSPDERTGYPGRIYGVGGGEVAGNMFIKCFDSKEKSIKFTHGIRLALGELVEIYHRNKDGPNKNFDNSYLLIFPGEVNSPLFDYPLVEYHSKNHHLKTNNKSITKPNGGLYD
jgi:hypothetical protein